MVLSKRSCFLGTGCIFQVILMQEAAMQDSPTTSDHSEQYTDRREAQ